MNANPKRKRGRPRKPKGGFEHVLYIRASADLLNKLDMRVRREQRLQPGRSISRADVARELLYAGLAAGGQP